MATAHALPVFNFAQTARRAGDALDPAQWQGLLGAYLWPSGPGAGKIYWPLGREQGLGEVNTLHTEQHHFDAIRGWTWRNTGERFINVSQPFLRPTTAITITAWVYHTEAGRTVISNLSGNYGYRFSLQTSNPLVALGNGSSKKSEGHTVSIAQNEWHFIAARWDGTNIHLWADEAKSSGDTFSGPIDYSSAAANTQIGATDGSIFWQGRLSDVRVYDRALSDGEIQTIRLQGDRLYRKRQLIASGIPFPPAASATGMPTIKSGLVPHAYWSSVRDQRGILYLANGVDRPQAWDGLAAATRNWGIDPASGTVTVSTTGASGAKIAGTYLCYCSWVNKDVTPEVVSNPAGPGSATVASGTTRDLILKFSASAPDTQITHKRFWLNTAGQATTFYKVTDISATANSHTDTSDDDTLSSGDSIDSVSNVGFDRNPPNSKRAFALFHRNRTHLFGSVIEKTGTISVAGTSVTGSGTFFRDSHVSQTLIPSGASQEYTVTAVSNATSMTIGSSATVSAGTAFRLGPFSTLSQWQWSKSGEPEYFPAANATTIYEIDGDEPTALFELQTAAYATKRRHMYRLAFRTDPLTDGGIFPVLSQRGAVNNRCVVAVGDIAYILDEVGVYIFDTSQAVPVDQPIYRLLQPSNEPAADRVNWSVKEKFHGAWDAKRNRVLFWVALGTDTEPKHALVYEIDAKRWTIEEYRQGITSSAYDMQDADGKRRVWVGDENGLVWAVGVSDCVDGAPPSANGTLRGTITTAANNKIIDSDASFYSTGDGLVGVPVYIDTGQAAGEWGLVKEQLGDTLTLKSNLGTSTAVGDTYIIGAIEATIQTKWFAVNPGLKQRLRKLRVFFQPEASSVKLRVKVFHDFSSSAYTSWKPAAKSDGVEIPAAATSDGVILAYLDTSPGVVDLPIGDDMANFVRFEMKTIDSERKPEILGYEYVTHDEMGSARAGGGIGD